MAKTRTKAAKSKPIQGQGKKSDGAEAALRGSPRRVPRRSRRSRAADEPPRRFASVQDEVVPASCSSSATNRMQVPRLEKIVVNMGVGEAIANPKLLEAAVEDLTQITGQKPAVTRARKSIANFKLREGMPIGCTVTLRGRAHVGVLRPAGQRRAAAYPRLPRRADQELRRPRQLHPGSQGADHLPGDRLRQGRRSSGA